MQSAMNTNALQFAKDGILWKAKDPTVFELVDGIFTIIFKSV